MDRFSRALARFSLFLAAAFAAAPAGATGAQPELIPQPRELQVLTQSFGLAGKVEIVLLKPVAPEDHFAAQSIATELKDATGRDISVVEAPRPRRGRAEIILGRFDQPEIGRLLRDRQLRTEDIGAQGYILDVEPKRVLVAGKDAGGLFYGAQTLRQLVTGTGGSAQILGVSLRDWPALATRGTQVDLARGPVPKLDYLKRIVRTIAEFKMNALFLYMEDSFRLKDQPLFGALSDTLSDEDWRQLVAYANSYHVELIPATEACGHLHKVLRFEDYSAMAERPHGHVLAAGDPQALNFLNGFYGQLTSVFPSPIIHIGCDETVELGRGRSANLVAQQGYGQVYVDNLSKVADVLRRYHRQVMFWGDIAVEHPEMISRLPRDLIVASWEYSYHPSYDPWLKPFEGTGMKIFVCPWASSTNVMIPDYEEAAANIRGFISDGLKAGAVGTDVTVWNDDGETLYGPNWWSIVYGAASAWEPNPAAVADFDRKFDWAFFRNTDHRFAGAVEQLGQLNELLRAGKPVTAYDGGHGGANDVLFWRDPFSAEGQKDVERLLPVASLMRLDAEAAYSTLVNGAPNARRNADTLPSLEFAALRLDALGMRYQYAEEIAERYRDALANQNDKRGLASSDLVDIDSTDGRLQDLRDYTTRLGELYRHLWLGENLPTWLPNVLQLYDRQSDLWQSLIAKYSLLRQQFAQHKPLPSAESLGLVPVAQASGSQAQPGSGGGP